jgi:two-component system sensor histidine kinase/response regulator
MSSEVTPTNDAAVLVVDDNPLIVNVLKSLLASQHYKVYVSNNGEEALDVLNKKEIDVVICDVMMPQMDGYQLHQTMRQKAEHAHIPFVFLTALSDNSEVSKGMETGADDYMVKPFDPRELLSLIKGKVQRSRHIKHSSQEKYDTFRKKIIHTLSHEFRTPLVAINTGTELLIEQKQTIDDKKIQNLLEAIRRGGLRLERLVSDFMLLQQIEAGMAQKLYNNRASNVLLAEVLDEVLEEQAELLSQDKFTVNVSNHDENLEVHIYMPHVKDILCRFISNSVKFKLKEFVIDINIYPQESEVVIEVKDRGLGIDVNKVKEAIDIFGQIDREKLEQQGSGLGLAIANRYAAINNGRIEFERRDGGGSIVSLILPRVQ